MTPVTPVAGSPARLAASITSSTKEGSCAEGTFPPESRLAYPLAAPFFEAFSGVNPIRGCFPERAVFTSFTEATMLALAVVARPLKSPLIFPAIFCLRALNSAAISPARSCSWVIRLITDRLQRW
jgi:hypothetical protein